MSSCSALYSFNEFQFAPDDVPEDLAAKDNGVEDAPAGQDAGADVSSIDAAPPEDTVVQDASVDVLPPADVAACMTPVAIHGGPNVCVTLGCPTDLCTTPDLHAVGGTNLRNLWAVGEYGVIYRFDGVAWLLENAGTSSDSLNGVLPFSGGVWAVGDNGVILGRLDTGSWVRTTSRTTQDLLGIAGSPSGFAVWAVGRHGVILSTTSGSLDSWREVLSPTSDDLVAISVADGYGLMASVGGSLFRKASTAASWSLLPTLGGVRNLHPTDVSVFASGQAWVSAAEGLFRLSGSTLTQSPTLMPGAAILSVWGDQNNATAIIRGSREVLIFNSGSTSLQDTDVNGLETLDQTLDTNTLVGVGRAGAVNFFRGGP